MCSKTELSNLAEVLSRKFEKRESDEQFLASLTGVTFSKIIQSKKKKPGRKKGKIYGFDLFRRKMLRKPEESLTFYERHTLICDKWRQSSSEDKQIFWDLAAEKNNPQESIHMYFEFKNQAICSGCGMIKTSNDCACWGYD